MTSKLISQKTRQLLRIRRTRRKLTKKSLFLFGWYYFREYFTHATPDFHLEMTEALRFENVNFRYLIEEMYKDSAKTSWSRIAFIWRICYEMNHFMCFVCHDLKKAEGHLFDIALALQTNKKLIADFGQLFYDDLWADEKHSQKKSIKEFITANRIKVKAYSTGMSIRGEIYDQYRPDYIAVDDIENIKTIFSQAATTEVINFLDEMFSGITAAANVVFTVNYISKEGSVAWLKKKAAGNPDFKLMSKALIENGHITWPSRFVATDAEARAINSVQKDKTKHVFSLEERKRTLGTRKFKQEYLNIPISNEEGIIKEPWVRDYEFTQIPVGRTRFNKVIMMDPQSGEKKDADSYGIAVLGWFDGDPHRYFLQIKKGKASQLKQAATLIETWQNHPTALLVGIEKLMTQVAVWQILVDWKNGTLTFDNRFFPRINNANRNMPILEVTPEGKDKVARLQVHEPAFERGEIHLHSTMKSFSENLIAFPNVEHDDDVDAAIYCLDYSYKSGFTQSEETDYNAEELKTIVGDAMKTKF